MKDKSTKDNKNFLSIKIKFIFILILSNACIYVLSATNNNSNGVPEKKNLNRSDYIIIRIKAKSFTTINNDPVIITDERNSFYIRNAFIIQKIVKEISPQSLEIPMDTEEYFIQVHKNESYKIYQKKGIQIYPNEMNFKRDRKEYEVIF